MSHQPHKPHEPHDPEARRIIALLHRGPGEITRADCLDAASEIRTLSALAEQRLHRIGQLGADAAGLRQQLAQLCTELETALRLPRLPTP